MKIAVIVNELNIRGVTHKQVLRLCQYLKKNNIDFVLCTKIYENAKTYKEFENFDIISLYNENLNLKNYGQKYDNQNLFNIIPDDIDIFNVHDNQLNSLIYLALRKKKKIVWQINDLPSAFHVGVNKKSNSLIKDNLTKLAIRYMVKKINVITVNVSKNRDRVKNSMKKNAEVLYCGVDINKRLKKHSFFDFGEEFNLLSMGVFLPYRNYEILILSIEKLRREGCKIRLDIIGNIETDIQYTKKIQNMIIERKIEKYVKIWGQVDDDTYDKLFNVANAFAFINIEQSWGLAVFEAMSAGLPTIVSNSVGAIELLHHNIDAIIVDSQDIDEICKILKKLMTDEAYYNSISDESARAVKEFTWDKLYSSKMLEIFQKLSEE